MLKLSILICSLEKRITMLDNLLSVLHVSCSGLPIEILHLSDNGEMKIGDKRNRLLEMSKGDYCSFIDDDDTVDVLYGKEIIGAINNGNPDCVGICGVLKQKDGNWQFRHSITVSRWCRDKKNRIYFRTPNHLNPIKRVFCLAAKFPASSFGEDRSYSERIRTYLKTEVFVERPLYYYTPSGERHP